jgi:ribosomal-protein-alanine N-acetyltransferase
MASPLSVSVRLVRPQDAEVLSRLETQNREYLQAGGPARSDEYVSVDGQARLIDGLLDRHAEGTCLPYLIEADGAVVGRMLVTAIVRGGFQSGVVGYWVAEAVTGRGIASAALTRMVEIAFGPENLHRLEAATTLANEASARVLTRAGFQQYGVAQKYLLMDGRWEDHRIFQLVNDAWTEPS